MKKIAFFICLGFSVLFAKSLEEIYLENGIVAVQNAIESNLQSKDYWSNKIKDMDLRYGYYEDDKLLTIVDKKSKNIFLYEYKNGKLNKKFNHEILTGLMGDKLKEGDLKTPVGVYNITRRFVPSDTYYGPVAFSLSYPNIYDQARDRTGGGIWIHGFPMQGVVREDTLKTKGCIAIPNNFLVEYEKFVGDKGGFVLINENSIAEASNDQISAIFAELFKWKKAWSDSDINKYLNFYDKNFIRFDGVKFDRFSEMKKSIFAKKEDKFIQFTKFEITPYPSTSKDKIFRVSFMEKYRTATYKFDGEKTLYVKLDGDKMKILTEQ
ncbi:peptidoglycan LD-carboxypeptidase [Campylobacter iguaniorum]|uniref:L,D-transpeptidase family protein n=1 Tax=Campylobacter iguaniorum TaxID=1244531 RepID=UPI00073A232F|nr:L,D-transpeptidase family protein [Campylobacter iguaniorum]ALV25288.1 peptidoglycan LD-carboxypeptidase [Campylobacter iguaniorum]